MDSGNQAKHLASKPQAKGKDGGSLGGSLHPFVGCPDWRRHTTSRRSHTTSQNRRTCLHRLQSHRNGLALPASSEKRTHARTRKRPEDPCFPLQEFESTTKAESKTCDGEPGNFAANLQFFLWSQRTSEQVSRSGRICPSVAVHQLSWLP